MTLTTMGTVHFRDAFFKVRHHTVAWAFAVLVGLCVAVFYPSQGYA